MNDRRQIAPLAIPCPTCEAPVGMSCPQFPDEDTNHLSRAVAAPTMKEEPVSLHLDMRIGNGQIGEITVTRQDSQHGNDPDRINVYRWWHVQDGRETTDLIRHRFGDGALVLAHKVLSEVVARQAITVEAVKKLGAELAPNV